MLALHICASRLCTLLVDSGSFNPVPLLVLLAHRKAGDAEEVCDVVDDEDDETSIRKQRRSEGSINKQRCELRSTLNNWSSVDRSCLVHPGIVQSKWTYRPRRIGRCASTAPIMLQIHMLSQTGNSLLVMCARIIRPTVCAN